MPGEFTCQGRAFGWERIEGYRGIELSAGVLQIFACLWQAVMFCRLMFINVSSYLLITHELLYYIIIQTGFWPTFLLTTLKWFFKYTSACMQCIINLVQYITS